MISALKKLGRDGRAATAVEFAIVGPVFILSLLLVVEVARMTWNKQVLQDVAFRSARCMMTGGLAAGEGCKTPNDVKDFAINQAQAAGIYTLNRNGVQVLTGGTGCNGDTNFSGVVLNAPFNGVATGFLPATLSAIKASACYPNQPPS